jgi:hypothetical protein
MDIVANNEPKTQFTKLSFWLNGDGSEWQDYNLPIPNIIKHTANGVLISWFISGYFGTAKGREFFTDIVSRFLISFKDLGISRKYGDIRITEQTHTSEVIHRLDEFQGLKSIQAMRKPSRKTEADCKDNTFWAIKYEAEAQIKELGLINYNQLLKWSFFHFKEKEKSTIRAKVRSIFNWYLERDFKLNSKRKESTMTRQQRALINSMNLAQDAQNKIIKAVNQLKISDSKINIAKVAKLAGISRNTVYKYKELLQ